jgi:GMP synthase-like glutamine amidotransferase
MRFLVIQHSPLDNPGVIRDFLAEDGIAWDGIDTYAGQAIPSLDDYAALIIMGGPQQTDQEAEHPWLVDEKDFIRRTIREDSKPVLGICLGAQLIAEVSGGRVGPMQQPEIGVLDVETLPGAAEDALLAGLPARAKAVQWHLHAILELPPGARLLMRSTAWENQAIRLGRAVYGLQFHMELSADMVQSVEAYPEYVAALEAQHGAGALARLVDDTEHHSADMSRSIRLIYDNFVKLARG